MDKSLPALITCFAYGVLLFLDKSHLDNWNHIAHFSGHLILFSSAAYAFLSFSPQIMFVTLNTHKVHSMEAFAHVVMGTIEPVYWILVIQNLVELLSKKN